MEELFNEIRAFTILSGGALAFGQILGTYLKSRSNKGRIKLANGHLIDKDDSTVIDILGNDGLILSKDMQLKEKYDYEGSIILGPTGSGKSTSYSVPNLLSNNLKGSIVVTDPKGELFTLTSGYQKEICKRKVYRFAPLETNKSEKYNLLENCKDNSEVLELASSLLFNGSLSIELSTGKKTGGAEWTQMCEPLFAAALLYCKNLEYPFNNIEFAFKLLINLKDKELDQLFKDSKNYDCIEQWNIFKMVQGADRTEGSIKITLATNLKLFTDHRINGISDSSTFNFEDFRKEPSILYICYPENRANYIAPFTAPFLTKMIDSFIDAFDVLENPLPIHMILDEFCNIGMIMNMNSKATTARSRKISINIFVQGLTQIYQIYGKDIGNTILNNLKTKLVLPSLSDISALNYISNLCGEKEIETISRSDGKNNKSVSYSKTKIRMFSENDLRCLENDQVLVVTSNKQPILTTQNTYYKNDKYIHNIKNPVEIEDKNTKQYDLYDHIQDLKIDIAIEKEENNDIKSEFFR